MRLLLAVFILVFSLPAVADEPKAPANDRLVQIEGGSPKPYTSGGPLPKYCTREEWNAAIEATVAATKDIPRGATAVFIRRANEVAARFGC